MRQLQDWLENYMAYTQRIESPDLYNLWCGLTVLSTALRRKCYCDWGELRGKVYPNLFVALVGPPGGRKGTAMRPAKELLKHIDVVLGADSLGSTQALYKELMDSEDTYVEKNGMTKKHKSISIWAEEFQVFLSDKDQMLIPSITDLFDCADVWKYKTLARKTEDLSNCWMTIIGAITPSLLQTKLTVDAVGGGLISRIIFAVGYGPKHRKALQYLTDAELETKRMLEQDLQEIANLSGKFTLSEEFLDVYVKWYEQDYDDSGIQHEKFMGYNHRRPLHLNKICMLLSVAESNDMVITADHFEKALAILKVTEQEMQNAFHGLGMSATADVYAKVLSFIEERESFDWTEIVSSLQMDVENVSQLRGFLEMAEQAGVVTAESSATESRYINNKVKQQNESPEYLDKTVFRLMDRNLIKTNTQGEENIWHKSKGIIF